MTYASRRLYGISPLIQNLKNPELVKILTVCYCDVLKLLLRSIVKKALKSFKKPCLFTSSIAAAYQELFLDYLMLFLQDPGNIVVDPGLD
jgi:hypothetical protein